jgi:phospholipase/lecithinase/hemolysin
MANLILGLPGPPAGLTGSQVDQAVALNPSTILLWIGANDALIAGLSGDFSRLTSIDRFYSSYKRLIDRLAKTDARLVVANIPDVTVIPYFMSAETLAAQSGFPIETVTAKLRINRRDYLRPCAVPIAIEILNNRADALPSKCAPTVPGLLFEPVPAVMKAGQADFLRAAVLAYNLVILERAIAHRATLVDTFSLLNRIKANGYIANGRKITMDFLGGFFTLDAMHPTNTGHAIIANEWIKTMNSRLGTSIPQVSVDNVAKNDPLVR